MKRAQYPLATCSNVATTLQKWGQSMKLAGCRKVFFVGVSSKTCCQLGIAWHGGGACGKIVKLRGCWIVFLGWVFNGLDQRCLCFWTCPLNESLSFESLSKIYSQSTSKYFSYYYQITDYTLVFTWSWKFHLILAMPRFQTSSSPSQKNLLANSQSTRCCSDRTGKTCTKLMPESLFWYSFICTTWNHTI